MLTQATHPSPPLSYRVRDTVRGNRDAQHLPAKLWEGLGVRPPELRPRRINGIDALIGQTRVQRSVPPASRSRILAGIYAYIAEGLMQSLLSAHVPAFTVFAIHKMQNDMQVGPSLVFLPPSLPPSLPLSMHVCLFPFGEV